MDVVDQHSLVMGRWKRASLDSMIHSHRKARARRERVADALLGGGVLGPEPPLGSGHISFHEGPFHEGSLDPY